MSKTANNIIFLLLFIEQEIISVTPLQTWIKSPFSKWWVPTNCNTLANVDQKKFDGVKKVYTG